jgi:hypothetical protein
MRRPSLLVCLRAAVVGVPALVIACGTNPPPGFTEGPTDSTTGSASTIVHTSTGTTVITTTSTIHLADGGVSTSTGVVTSTFTQVSTQTTQVGGTSTNGSGSTNTSGASTSQPADGGSDSGPSARMCPVASPDVVADFEDAKALDVAANGFAGAWSANDSQKTSVKSVTTSTDPNPTCNKYALHGTVPGPIASGGYGQIRADFNADDQGAMAEPYPKPFDISKYQGIKFDISPGSGSTKFPITFEMLGQESTPVTDPNSMNPVGGTAMTNQVDQYNNRGWTINSLSSGWQTITVPFAMLIPHWFPSPGSSGCASSGPCEAPLFNPAHALGLQFATNPDQAANGSFDILIDNVTLVTDASAGLVPPGMTMPTWHDGSVGSCTKPTNASGKYLLWAYYNWKNQFVKGNAGSQRYVISPEIDGGAIVSEGIGYGLLLSVYFNDQSLFNDLWSYWSAHEVSGTHLMNWKYTTSGSNSGQGSATDADEDAAFANIEAGKRWGGSYASNASSIISDIWSKDIDSGSLIPKGGSNYSSVNPTNPSYFAPAYYRIFNGIDSGHNWNGVASKSVSVISALSSSSGLLPAWCTSTCTAAGSNGAATDGDYQYDSHRIPWRIGIDYCWNGSSTSGSGGFLDKNSAYFSNIATTNALGQIGRIMDMYTPTGGSVSGSAPNSMSIVGTSGVGAMHSSAYASYANQAWQFVLDGLNRGTLDFKSGQASGYSYYNSTIGLMTALMMSGNFYQM